MTQHRYIALDLETTQIRFDHTVERIHCVGLHSEEGSEVMEWGEEAIYSLEAMLTVGYILVCHNASFDIAVLRSHGVRVSPSQYRCTQVLAHAINPQLQQYSLDFLTGGNQKIDYAERMGVPKPEVFDIPFNPTMKEYCAVDTQLCWELWQQYAPHLEKDKRLRESYETVLMPFVEVMMSMAEGGMEVDAIGLMTLLKDISTEINMKYEEFLGFYPTIPKLKWNGDIKQWVPTGKFCTPSLSSPNDVTSLLLLHGWKPDDFKKDTGRPVTSQAILKRLVATESAPPALRQMAARMCDIKSLIGIQTQCVSLLEIITGTQSMRVYANWHQTGTVTHRLSSSAPNCQNFSTRHPVWGKRMRSCFIPPTGYSMLVGDLAQIELAILAYYLELFCEDSSMADAARREEDFHSANAKNWLGAKEGDADFKAKRAVCKNGIFATGYGAAAPRLSLTLNIPVSEALEIINTVYENIEAKQLKEIFWQTLATTRPIHPIPYGYRKYTSGVFYDYLGVRHFYPDISSSDRYAVSSAKRQSFNCLMQGGCFSIFAHLLNQLFPHIKAVGGWVSATIHDEALIIVPTQCAEELLLKANEVFSSFKMDTPQGGIPIRAEFNIVNSWAEK